MSLNSRIGLFQAHLSAVPDTIPLSLLSPGVTAYVSDFLGCADTIHRLQELGLRSGAQIEMVQPGSPCIIRLAGHKLCFRADELMSVFVRPSLAS
jgi:Fe2+ transport system protein FeoA